MKIIHSSDLHLNQKYPERIEALDRILELGAGQQADAVLIAGDFFDSKADCDYYRPQLRQKFSNLKFKVILIPGNHDYGSFEGDLFFGNDIKVANSRPFEIIDFEHVRVVAVPYYRQDFNQYLYQVNESRSPDKINILMMHCSLDAPFIEQEDLGEEKAQKYLPVSSRVLSELDFDYILAGHYHSRFMVQKISEKCTFVYPGSPVSVTKKEQGKRAVAILDTAHSRQVSQAYIDSKYYDSLHFSFQPEIENKVMEELRQSLGEHDCRYAHLTIAIDGFTSLGEKTLKAQIDNIIKGYDSEKLDIDLTYRDISEVLSDPLYINFKQKLEKADFSQEIKKDIDNQCRLYFSKLRMD
ncbi:MAG: DNA repair exonuclease [Actinomycetia bacterium]|nr:DNA repair exonuclease [Actinomycetes bacterium]